MSYKSAIEDLIKDMELKGTTGANTERDSAIEKLRKDIYGSTEFKYDASQDEAAKAARKEYTREADRTMRDTLAQGNARTNGFANSAAITAASQARDYTMSQLADREAELEERAYNRHMNENNAKLSLLSALEDMAASEKGDYLAMLDRLESINDEDRQTAAAEVEAMIKIGGVPSDELLSKTGWSQEYINAVKQNTYDSMDTASMQRYLNSKGANLDVDGSWGPKTEAAYQAVFGKASGRQESYGYSSSSSGYSSSSGTLDTSTNPTIKHDILSGIRRTAIIAGNSGGATAAEKVVQRAIDSGKITQDEGKVIMNNLGADYGW